MRTAILTLILAGALAGCGQNSDQQATREGTSGSGKTYGRGGENDLRAKPDVRAGASRTATDLRPTGGSMAGAGGAGPGYDGSGQGGGKNGTVPAPGAGFGGSLTNSQATVTNTLDHAATNQGALNPGDSPPRAQTLSEQPQDPNPATQPSANEGAKAPPTPASR
jgi:hypothetical protein